MTNPDKKVVHVDFKEKRQLTPREVLEKEIKEAWQAFDINFRDVLRREYTNLGVLLNAYLTEQQHPPFRQDRFDQFKTPREQWSLVDQQSPWELFSQSEQTLFESMVEREKLWHASLERIETERTGYDERFRDYSLRLGSGDDSTYTHMVGGVLHRLAKFHDIGSSMPIDRESFEKIKQAIKDVFPGFLF